MYIGVGILYTYIEDGVLYMGDVVLHRDGVINIYGKVHFMGDGEL